MLFANVIQVLYICDINIIYMETTVTRKQTAFRLREDLIERLKIEAKRNNRSLNNLVESVLMESLYLEPNMDTKEAMLEAKGKTPLSNVDVSSFDSFLKSVK